MVGFGLDYACAHIIIPAEISIVNPLLIQADFVTERVMRVGSARISEGQRVLHL